MEKDVMNPWLFAGCMLLVVVTMNICIWMGKCAIKWFKLWRMKRKNEYVYIHEEE
ncbi:hypothetical protein [Bacillus cereus]|uniref:hypothetical protein n=1 Tax=Bacillus cereus TaxID=1396 RepID=UPI0015965E8F|nr:hypothetical protein [Bacillus cereus]